jgi:serine/threonine-protein kinase
MIHIHKLLAGKDNMQEEIWFGKYRILKLLGQGGTAKVYLAEHIKLNSFRAIKYISKHHPLYKLQLKEAQILKDLKHSCIPIIYDIEEDEEGSYIIEQYLEGVTLKDYVMERNTLSEDMIICFALQLCDLIHYLHSVKRPVLYLDLKPENIMVTGKTLMLIDFGSAIYRDEIKSKTKFYGTIGYAAPELYNNHPVDEKSDIYGIGMLLYFMVTGKLSYKSREDIKHIDYISNCSKKLKHIISRCLRYNSSQRYTCVSQLQKHLSAIMNNKNYKVMKGSSIEIGIAGSQPRIGTTHLSFSLCTYLIQKNISCLYIEYNKSRCLWKIQKRYFNLKKNKGVVKINSIPMVNMDYAQVMDLSKYNIIVKDYGSLDSDNKEEYLKSQVKILLLGAKDWELGFSEEALKLITEYKDIIFLFNYVDTRQFGQAQKSMIFRNCLRIPYEPNPFAKFKDKVSHDFFKELADLCFEGVIS